MQDTYDGETAMKEKTLGQNKNCKCPTNANENMNQYLRMTQGMKLDEKNGWARFCDKVDRAMFYPFVSAIHEQSLGMINSRKADVEIPKVFDYLLTNANRNQEPLSKVLSNINSAQLLKSRIGAMAEVNKGTTTAQNTFTTALYSAESIIDWDYTVVSGRQIPSFVNLKECIQVRDGAEIKHEDRYLVLQLDEDGNYFQWLSDKAEVDPSTPPVERNVEQLEMDGKRFYPLVGGKPSKQIPFVCINAEKIGFDIENPFLEPVADASIKLFQADSLNADNLHFTSTSTMVLAGVTKDEKENGRFGAGGCVILSDPTATVKFESASSDSLNSTAQNVESLKMYCASLGVDVMQINSPESGIALNTKIETKAFPLQTLSETGAGGLATLLQICAEWQGVSGDIKIVGNTDFKTEVATPKDLLELMGVMQGGGLTQQDFFNYKKKNGYTDAETLADEQKQLEIETVV
jgi:hypothetical protein